MKRLLITGGRGMAAADFARVALARGFEVTAASHQELDVTRWADVRQMIEALRPDAIVHTVGLAVDPCESDAELADRVHVWGTACVARACERVGAVLINLSTCGVFGDERRFYSERDGVVLKTEYARSKARAEQAATEACSRTFNIRPGWLYGGTTEHKKNFVVQRFLEARRSPVMRSASDKFGCPSYTGDLARVALDLLETEQYGLYHVTNAGGCSRFDYVSHIVRTFGLDTPIEAVDSTYFPRPSMVPDCEMLDNGRLRFIGIDQPEPWQEALERYVNREARTLLAS
jgi:dTDP-4-dehydrorhamnose reductase